MHSLKFNLIRKNANLFILEYAKDGVLDFDFRSYHNFTKKDVLHKYTALGFYMQKAQEMRILPQEYLDFMDEIKSNLEDVQIESSGLEGTSVIDDLF